MGNNDSSVETFLQWIKASDNIVFFGGAGVSGTSEKVNQGRRGRTDRGSFFPDGIWSGCK